jgi:hypothetical protein
MKSKRKTSCYIRSKMKAARLHEEQDISRQTGYMKRKMKAGWLHEEQDEGRLVT